MIYAFTGHRPNKLGGYSVQARHRLVTLARRFLLTTGSDASLCIVGMAQGWDMAVAEACWGLKVPYMAAIPFRSQAALWPEESRMLWKNLIWYASEVHVVSDGEFTAAKMQKRNQFMVDQADRIVALWDGSPGGTGNCVRYAQSKNKPLINLWGQL